MADIVAAQAGFFDQGSTWVGGAVPGDGDTANNSTFDVTIRQAHTVGDGTDCIKSNNFTGGGRWTFATGCVLTAKGSITTQNRNIDGQAGAEVNFLTANAADYFRFQHGAFGGAKVVFTTTGTPSSIFLLSHSGPGKADLQRSTDGAFNLANCTIRGFGEGAAGVSTTPPMRIQFGNNANDEFIADNLVFDQCKGLAQLLFWGGSAMGDINIDGVYVTNPDAGYKVDGGTSLIQIDGAIDATTDTGVTNSRIIRNIRVEGASNIRHVGQYNVDGMRHLSRPIITTNNWDAASSDFWFNGDHMGDFVRLIGSATGCVGRDTTDNPHGWVISRCKETNIVFEDFVWDYRQTAGTDTGDFFATSAASSANDFLINGQIITMRNCIMLRNPNAVGATDGSIFCTFNGDLTPGTEVLFTPEIRFENNVLDCTGGSRLCNFDEAGTTPAGTVTVIKDNVFHNHDGLGSGAIVASTGGSPATDIVVPSGIDNNSLNGFPLNYDVPLTGAFGVDYGLTELINTDPEFVDTSRNLEKFARGYGITEDDFLVGMIRAGLDGFDENVYSVANFVKWCRDGLHPTEIAHQTASSTAGRLGSTLSVVTPEITSVNGGDPVQEGDTGVVVGFDSAITASGSVQLYDKFGNRQAVSLNSKPTATQEAFNWADKGDQAFGASEVAMLVGTPALPVFADLDLHPADGFSFVDLDAVLSPDAIPGLLADAQRLYNTDDLLQIFSDGTYSYMGDSAYSVSLGEVHDGTSWASSVGFTAYPDLDVENELVMEDWVVDASVTIDLGSVFNDAITVATILVTNANISSLYGFPAGSTIAGNIITVNTANAGSGEASVEAQDGNTGVLIEDFFDWSLEVTRRIEQAQYNNAGGLLTINPDGTYEFTGDEEAEDTIVGTHDATEWTEPGPTFTRYPRLGISSTNPLGAEEVWQQDQLVQVDLAQVFNGGLDNAELQVTNENISSTYGWPVGSTISGNIITVNTASLGIGIAQVGAIDGNDDTNFVTFVFGFSTIAQTSAPRITSRMPVSRALSARSLAIAVAGREGAREAYTFSGRRFYERPNHNPFKEAP